MTGRRRLLALLLCLLLAGCGVPVQEQPVTIDIPVPSEPSPQQPPPTGPRSVTLYFVRDDRLAPADRSAPDTTAAGILELLDAGPGPGEAAAGVRTALMPASLSLAEDVDRATGTAVVEVTREFTSTSGANQLLAVAQVVWTVTEAPGVRQVRMTSDGNPIEVPTDGGLSRDPVTRDDYRTVSPLPGRDATGDR